MKVAREKLRENMVFKGFCTFVGLIFPFITLTILAGSNFFADKIHVYSLLWIAFYSSILIVLFLKSLPLKIILIIMNFLSWGVWAFGSLMGGIGALIALIIKTIVPFIPLFVLS